MNMKKKKKRTLVEMIVDFTCIGLGLYIMVAFSVMLSN